MCKVCWKDQYFRDFIRVIIFYWIVNIWERKLSVLLFLLKIFCSVYYWNRITPQYTPNVRIVIPLWNIKCHILFCYRGILSAWQTIFCLIFIKQCLLSNLISSCRRQQKNVLYQHLHPNLIHNTSIDISPKCSNQDIIMFLRPCAWSFCCILTCDIINDKSNCPALLSKSFYYRCIIGIALSACNRIVP